MVLDVDEQKRRVSLGLKQCLSNPWDDFLENCPTGIELEGDIKNITEFGLFVGLPGGIDGMVHLSDLDWNRTGDEAVKDYHEGDRVKVRGTNGFRCAPSSSASRVTPCSAARPRRRRFQSVVDCSNSWPSSSRRASSWTIS